MEKEYLDLQFAENEFYRAYSLALKVAGSNKGTIARVEKIRTESDLKESELYIELQSAIKVAEAYTSQSVIQADNGKERSDKIEKYIELLRKQYATKKSTVFDAATIKLRAIALGR
jgi:hypothetical protein